MEEREMIGNTEKTFLALLRAALHTGRADLPEDGDWPAVFTLAGNQHVLPMILEAAWRSGASEELLAPVRPAGMRLMMTQARRTAAFLALYQRLADMGLYPLVLKGLVCRLLYPEPDLRLSGDEDLLVRHEDFRAVHEALLGCGLSCDCDGPLEELSEITYTGGDLRIELHLSLFPPEEAAYGGLNALFEGAQERAVFMEAEGIRIRALSPTDHLLYLICHAYKHFLYSGVGIRQVCDIGMFTERYGEEIDWDRIRKGCEEFRTARFTAALFAVAGRHLGFAMPGAFGDLETDEVPMMLDMLKGGIFGAAEEDRLHSASITLEAAASRRQGRKSRGLLASVFPPLKSMKEKYPYLKKHPFLLPAAWSQRLGEYLSRRGKEVRPSESIRIGKERIRLLREYGIID